MKGVTVAWSSPKSAGVPAVSQLSLARCFTVLKGSVAGHLALSQGALPLVVPVTCTFDGSALLVRAARDILGGAASQPGIVAFQTAATGLDRQWRCEVLVRGPAAVLDPPPAHDQSPPQLALVPPEDTVVFLISLELVTGWQYSAPAPLA